MSEQEIGKREGSWLIPTIAGIALFVALLYALAGGLEQGRARFGEPLIPQGTGVYGEPSPEERSVLPSQGHETAPRR